MEPLDTPRAQEAMEMILMEALEVKVEDMVEQVVKVEVQVTPVLLDIQALELEDEEDLVDQEVMVEDMMWQEVTLESLDTPGAQEGLEMILMEAFKV